MKDMVKRLENLSSIWLAACLISLVFCMLTVLVGFTALLTGHYAISFFTVVLLAPQVFILKFLESKQDAVQNHLYQTKEIYQRHLDTLDIIYEEMNSWELHHQAHLPTPSQPKIVGFHTGKSTTNLGPEPISTSTTNSTCHTLFNIVFSSSYWWYWLDSSSLSILGYSLFPQFLSSSPSSIILS